MVRKVKDKKSVLISAGVTPHHLFLETAVVKPVLGTKADRKSLWEGLQDKTIDIVESDHAPHTIAEKQSSTPPSGVPGLETTLGLLFLAVHNKKLTETDVIRLLYANPKRFFKFLIKKHLDCARSSKAVLYGEFWLSNEVWLESV